MKWILIAIAFLIPVNVVAQTSTQTETIAPTTESTPKIVDSNSLQVKLVKGNQHPETKEVNFTLVIYPQITTDRLQVSWTGSGVAVPLASEKSKTLSVTSGTVTSLPITFDFKPRNLSSNPLSVIKFTVQAFQASGTLTSTITQDFFTDATGSIIPITAQVSALSTAITIMNIAQVLIGVVVLMIASLLGYNLARRWIYTGNTI